MSEPAARGPVTSHGVTYCGDDRLHSDPARCPHSNNSACRTCDFDRYYASKHANCCGGLSTTN